MSEYLYVISCNEFHKIGIARDVSSRLAQLQTGNPYVLEVVLSFEFERADLVERLLHQKFSKKRSGGEWFLLERWDLDDICKICELSDGIRVNPATAIVSEEEVEEAEIEESGLRTELRIGANGDPRGVALYERGGSKKFSRYVGVKSPEFQKYLDMYLEDHPKSRIFTGRENGK